MYRVKYNYGLVRMCFCGCKSLFVNLWENIMRNSRLQILKKGFGVVENLVIWFKMTTLLRLRDLRRYNYKHLVQFRESSWPCFFFFFKYCRQSVENRKQTAVSCVKVQCFVDPVHSSPPCTNLSLYNTVIWLPSLLA